MLPNKVAKKKFKDRAERFYAGSAAAIISKTLRGRRNTRKGQLSISEEVGKKDFIRFNAQSCSEKLYLCRGGISHRESLLR